MLESFPSVSIGVHQWFDPVSYSKAEGRVSKPEATQQSDIRKKTVNHERHQKHERLGKGLLRLLRALRVLCGE